MLGKSPSIQNGEVRDRKRLFYINHIFESNSNNRYTKTALLYQDILKFENDFDKKYGSEFTFNDLAKWLMKQNLGFATYYSDSKAHVTMSNRIANRRDSIQNCIDDFISSKLISIVGTKKAQKNDFRTQLYKFTQAGEVLSYLLSARKWINIPSEVPKINLMLLEMIAGELLIQASCINSFTFYLYMKCSRIEECSKAVIRLLWIMLHDDDADVQNQYLDGFLFDIIYLMVRHREISPSFFESVFKEALFEQDEQTRGIILQYLKLHVEEGIIEAGAPGEWEKLWFDNIRNYTEVVLYGKCRNCSQGCPVIIPLFEYFAKYSDDDLHMNCTKCFFSSVFVGCCILCLFLVRFFLISLGFLQEDLD